MLDIKRIKENPDAIKAGMKAKEVDCDATIDRILELDGEEEFSFYAATAGMISAANEQAEKDFYAFVKRDNL